MSVRYYGGWRVPLTKYYKTGTMPVACLYESRWVVHYGCEVGILRWYVGESPLCRWCSSTLRTCSLPDKAS